MMFRMLPGLLMRQRLFQAQLKTSVLSGTQREALENADGKITGTTSRCGDHPPSCAQLIHTMLNIAVEFCLLPAAQLALLLIICRSTS